MAGESLGYLGAVGVVVEGGGVDLRVGQHRPVMGDEGKAEVPRVAGLVGERLQIGGVASHRGRGLLLEDRGELASLQGHVALEPVEVRAPQ